MELRLSASEDGAGPAGFLVDEVSLRTQAPGDVAPPRIGCRVEGESGIVLLLVDARDPSGVSTADLTVDGTPVAKGAHRLSATFDSSTVADGDHLLEVRARDAAGNAAACQAHFWIDNGLETIRDGGFEEVATGGAAGWTAAGDAFAGLDLAADDPSPSTGRRGAQLGGRPGTGSVSQLIEVPAGLDYKLAALVRARTDRTSTEPVDVLTMHFLDPATGEDLTTPLALTSTADPDPQPWRYLSVSRLRPGPVLVELRATIAAGGATTFTVDDVSLKGWDRSRPLWVKAAVRRAPHFIALYGRTPIEALQFADLDGQNLDYHLAGEWELYLDPADVAPGAHELCMVLYMDVGEPRDCVAFTMDAPLPDDDEPAIVATATVGEETVTLDAAASDAGGVGGVGGVNFTVDGEFAGFVRAPPYRVVRSRTDLRGGRHTVVASTYDSAGHAASATATFELPRNGGESGGGGGCSTGDVTAGVLPLALLFTLRLRSRAPRPRGARRLDRVK